MQEVIRSNDNVQVIVFTLGEERYGVDISQVREIIKPSEITRIPNAPDFVEGVINLRGQITTIINLRKRFNMEPKPIDNNTRIIVVEYDNAVIGMMVDNVTEVKYLPVSEIEELPQVITSRSEARFLKGVGKLPDGLLILIDLNKVLSDEEYEKLK
ncbi:chemotaxis protein CheW [Geoglobus acetivorans]|uniref:Chemotaxis protein CheW n=1 Tax=Geoglobus acetivorans TaxID=565033 RepID=A0A0A7GFH8_GEOAI|nr:Positive regulator of CheA protein activity (CheW) [Geoglobus acetivorans]MBE8539202.1 chemotaxis protein CheW [Geoglobus acetivorans]